MHWQHKDPTHMATKPIPGSTLIIVGDAPSKVYETHKAMSILPQAKLMTINNGHKGLGLHFDYLATVHCDTGTLGKPYIPLHDLPEDIFIIGKECHGDEHERVSMIVHAEPLHGTSALIGTLAALNLGFEKILLAGCPMLPSTGYGSESKLGAWKEWVGYFNGRVRAISGSLINILGDNTWRE